ncbi:MAG TPA: trypsin-like peptidase domain-containing protein [Candidatus Dormibacteraeota bacterium]|nr:trypsin-like peptidase domain-containing protein [Candidatus Dormibacteraeota bacterium]
MIQDENQDKTKELGAYGVASAKKEAGRTVSFTVPAMPKPRLRLGAGAPKTPRGRVGAVLLLFVLASLLSGFGGAWLEIRNSHDSLVVGGTLSNQKKIVTTQSQLISQIAKTVGPSVVSVNVNISNGSSSQNGFGLFGFAQPENEQAAGTGIIISSAGLIVTNRHVVPAGTTSVSVTLSDGTELKNVSVIGRTSDSDSLDIAFLKINDAKGHKLVPAAIGDSSTVQVGDDVVAIGNALGQFQNTVTSGIISGYGRSVQASDSSGSTSSAENLDDLFQTDAAINEGNSGGPLVNLNGQVIGINTATAGNAQNIGFAIPINDVRGLIGQVLKTGKFARPYLGVQYIPLTADVANEYKLSVQNGAFIAPSADPTSPSIISGSPAASAGLQTNDVITAVNGTNIDQTHSLTSLLDQHQPGDKITLSVLRGSKSLSLDVTLGSVPSS